MPNAAELLPQYQKLFAGLTSAFGTGAGRWVKRPLRPIDWVRHLEGVGPGIGIAPLRPDSTVLFAAIDLDEPDFNAAYEMQSFIPGPSYIERSRSGNAHVWVFFDRPVEAWIPMGILREATFAAGKEHVEVFPKNHDFSNVRLGNYINLPFHGSERPTLERVDRTMYDGTDQIELDGGVDLGNDKDGCLMPQTLERFLEGVQRNDVDRWRKRSDWLQILPPEQRERSAEFGKQQTLHICAQHVIEHAETNPVLPGHRSVVFFNLAKALTNWELVDHDEAYELLQDVNSASPYPISEYELRRILRNAEDGQYTSTGCDNPTFAPYAHPDCPIANA